MWLTIQDLEDLIEGGALLGSGGGGNKSTGRLLLDYIKQNGQYPLQLLMSPEEPERGDTTGCVIADIGANSSSEDNQYDAVLSAFQTISTLLKNQSNQTLSFVLPIETGPENSLAPFVVSAHFGIPVIDADGAGRAIPVLELSTYADICPFPTILSNSLGDYISVHLSEIKDLDVMLRPITSTKLFGNSGSLAIWPAEYNSFKQYMNGGAISYAIECGRLLRNLTAGHVPDATMVARLNARHATLLTEGTVVAIDTTINGGFDYGCVKIHGNNGEKWSVLNQNENMLCYEQSQQGILLSAPASICYLKTDGTPVTNAEIAIGDSIFLLGITPIRAFEDRKYLEKFRSQLEELSYYGELKYLLNDGVGLGTLLMRLFQ